MKYIVGAVILLLSCTVFADELFNREVSPNFQKRITVNVEAQKGLDVLEEEYSPDSYPCTTAYVPNSHSQEFYRILPMVLVG